MSSKDSRSGDGWDNAGWNMNDWNNRAPGGAQGGSTPRGASDWNRTLPAGGPAGQKRTPPAGNPSGWNRTRPAGNPFGWNRTQPAGNTPGWNRPQPPGTTQGWNNGTGGGNNGTESEVLSWVVIGLCFVLFWPVGLFLLIRKLSDGKSTTNRVSNSRSSAAQVQRQMNDRARQSRTRQQAQAAQRSAVQNTVPAGWAAPGQAAAAAQQRETFPRRVVKPPSMKKGTRLALKIVGGFLAVFGGMAAMGVLALADLPFEMWDIVQLLQSLALTGAGGLMLGKGFSMDRAARRYQNYLAVMGNVQSISFAQLASITGYPEKKIIDDLDRMIARNYFGPTAYLDQSLGYFFRSRTAAEEAEAEKRAAAATPREAEEGYAGVLRSIRRTNDRIADPALSRKINRLEEVTAQIFRAIEKDEQKAAQMRTFLEYYLPTTQKLLDSYAEFEATGVDGENLRMSKEKIEETMDNIIRGFEHQLCIA